ncbi:MAG: GNAT family N-acetyltransferase [bacterium]|nr:GNAT family N-acetyltransferase [bacterium]
MIKVETVSKYNKDRIYSFLKYTKYRKFNLWPNVTNDNITEFLFKEVHKIQNTDKIFIATLNDEIITLLSVNNLYWDTQHFGFKCAKIDYLLTNKNLDNCIIEKSLEQVLIMFQRYCLESNIKFVSTSIDSGDIITNLAVQRTGFSYILTWIDGVFTDSNKVPEVKDDVDAGIIKAEEIDYFTKISSVNYFQGGRFYLDKNFDRKLINKMYANLIKSSYNSKDIMLVYRINNQPVGLFICKKVVSYKSFSNLKVAHLRYLVVAPEFRNRKVAYDLFIKTIEFLKNKSDLITTGLEIHNLPSLNLHMKIGFKFNYTHNVYHCWVK